MSPEQKHEAMNRPKLFRAIALVTGIGLFLFALGVFFVLPGVMQFWIWPKTPPLGCVFVAAMFAGGAAPLLWVGLSGHLSAIRAAMLTGVVANTGIALHLFAKHALPGNGRYLPFSALFAFGAILAGTVFTLTTHLPARSDRKCPPVVRWAFLLASAILLPVGVSLVLDVPHVFPIPLTTDMAAVYGWFFLGSFAYYAYGFWKPSWLNSIGQLLSFWTYDLLMIPPYVGYRSLAYPEDRTSLFVYLAMLLASAVFCSYFLLVDPRTRLFKSRASIPLTAQESA
jgi:hypothetical protein